MIKLFITALAVVAIIGALAVAVFAQVGKRSISLTWTEASCPTCTFNVYRGSATGVCSGSPTPYATGVTTTSYTDTSVTAGQTYVYAVSAVLGVESACSSEVQSTVPSPPNSPSGLSGVTH